MLLSGVQYSDSVFLYVWQTGPHSKSSQCLSSHIVTGLFLVMRTSKSSLSNFQIRNTGLLTIISVMYIRYLWLVYLKLEVCTSRVFSPILPPCPPTPSGSHQPVLGIYELVVAVVVLASTCKLDSVVPAFLTPTHFSIVPSRCVYVVASSRISFLWLNSIPLCFYAVTSLSTHPLVDA